MRGLQGRWGQSVQIVSIRFSLTGTRSWPALLNTLDILFHWSAKGKKVKSGGFKEHTYVQQQLSLQRSNSKFSLLLSFQPLFLPIPLKKGIKSTVVTVPQTCHRSQWQVLKPHSWAEEELLQLGDRSLWKKPQQKLPSGCPLPQCRTTLHLSQTR